MRGEEAAVLDFFHAPKVSPFELRSAGSILSLSGINAVQKSALTRMNMSVRAAGEGDFSNIVGFHPTYKLNKVEYIPTAFIVSVILSDSEVSP